MKGLLPVVLAAALAWPAPAEVTATEPASGRRVVAIGDVHGTIEPLRSVLRAAALIDESDRWIGGDAVLVQTGDLTDRGAHVRQVVELLMRLEDEAPAAGGEVVSLLGNHEIMNLVLELRDVNAEAYAAFADGASEKRRKSAYREWQDLQRRRAHYAGAQRPSFPREVRDSWMVAHPPGFLEYLAAFGPDGEIGRWLRRRPVAAHVGDSVFVHGGISPDLADRELGEIDRLIRDEIAAFDRCRQTLLDDGVILPSYNRADMLVTLREDLRLGLHGPADSDKTVRLQGVLEMLEAMGTDWWSFKESGPVWFRGYARWPEEELAPWIGPLLERHGARRIVAGHTPSSDGRTVRRLDGRIFLIDTGLYWSDGRGGGAVALEIGAGGVSEIEAGRPVERPAAGALMERAELLAVLAERRAAVDEDVTATRLPPPPRILLGPDGELLPLADDDAIMEFLATAKVVDSRFVGQGITRPRLLTLERGGLRLRAIFHDVDVYRERARLPELGFVVNFRDSYRSQVAAYRVARLLGLDNVPPAVIRRFESETGSAALWIEGGTIERDRLQTGAEPVHPIDYQRRFFDLRVFDNLINNTDRNQGNILFDAAGKFWYIDQTRSFGGSSELPDPRTVVRCSRSLWDALRRLDRTAVQVALGDLLGPGEIRYLLKRRDKLVQLIQKKIDQLGEDRVLFTHGVLDDLIKISVEEAAPG